MLYIFLWYILLLTSIISLSVSNGEFIFDLLIFISNVIKREMRLKDFCDNIQISYKLHNWNDSYQHDLDSIIFVNIKNIVPLRFSYMKLLKIYLDLEFKHFLNLKI